MIHGESCLPEIPGTGDGRPLRHIAVGVIERAGEVLVSRRPPGVPLGGLWEFPGGKVERGEDIRAALARELDEELGLEVRSARPLIRVPHRDPHYPVLLDVWQIEEYRGEPYGREGQRLEWVPKGALRKRAFPVANRPIITAVNLPHYYLITPEPGPAPEPFLARLEQRLAAGIGLVQLRARGLAPGPFRELAAAAIRLCRAYRARILLNAPPELAGQLGADGVHLSSLRLMQTQDRPVPDDMLLGVSCHNGTEITQAARIGADFLVLGPVKPTASHPGAQVLGWEGLRLLTEQADRPVYALGGMAPTDLRLAWDNGAQGVAAISGLWEERGKGA